MPSSAGAPKKMSNFLSRLLNPVYDAATNFATEQRGWFMVFFVLPFSLVYDAYSNMRSYCIRLMFSAPALHAKRVEAVQAQLLKFQLTGKGRRLCTARPGWQSITMGDRSYKSGNASYPIRVNMMDILQFDANKRTVKVEPLVSMGQLSHFLIPKGFTLPILPELDDLTVGGLYMGVGIESSSHKFGLFNDTVLEAEVVTAKGQLLVCSRTQNRDLFDALPWSYGTLGFLVSLTLRIVPCKQYIKMWYVPTFDRHASTKVFQMLSLKQQDFDFVESLHYTRDKMVSMPAKFVDSIKFSKRNRIGLWYKPWFFKHVESFFSSAKLSDEQTVSGLESSANVEQWLDENFKYEFIPLRDYYHRHSKSIFWELEEIIPFGNHFLCRYLLGWALPPKISFIKFTQTQKIKDLYEANHVAQDMMVPFSKMDASLDCFEENYKIYPLWVCPYRAYDYKALNATLSGGTDQTEHRCFLRKPENLIPGEDFEMYVDLGAYGTPQPLKDKKPFDVVKAGKTVEEFVYKVHGFQMLYATSYQERDEFRAMFDHAFYDQIKARYDPDGSFPEVFEKVCKNGMKSWNKISSKKGKSVSETLDA